MKPDRDSIILILRLLILLAYGLALADTTGRYERYWASLFDLIHTWSFEFSFGNYRVDNVISIIVFLLGIIYSATRIHDARISYLVIDVVLVGILTSMFMQSINVNLLGL